MFVVLPPTGTCFVQTECLGVVARRNESKRDQVIDAVKSPGECSKNEQINVACLSGWKPREASVHMLLNMFV